MFHAISHQTEGRVATAMPGCGQQEHSADTGKEGHTEVCEQIPGHFSEKYGGGTQRSSGSIFLPRRRQDLCLPSRGDAAEHTEESIFRENGKGLSGRRHRNPQDINGKGPCNPCVNPTGIFKQSRSRDNASDGQSSNDEGNGRAIAPTCRRDYGLVNGIPVGYETDDSWDNDSHTHEHTHTHNIVPLLTLRPWNTRPHRGRGQPHRQNNNINVRTGNAPYSRPWDNQPYGRRTRSQQALHARAYHKIQCRYPIQ